MALMYFKDEKTEGVKQYMGKTAVRKLIERKDKDHWGKMRKLENISLGFELKCEKLQLENKELESERKALWITLGVVSGYHILSTILGWYGNLPG